MHARRLSAPALAFAAWICAGCWIEQQATVRPAATAAPELRRSLPAPRSDDGASAEAAVQRYRPKRKSGWRAHLAELLPHEFSPRRIAARTAQPTVAALCSDPVINPESKALDASQVAALDALIVEAGAPLRAAVLAHSQCHHDALLRSSDAGRVAVTRSMEESRALEAELSEAHGAPQVGWISAQVLLPADRAPGVLHLYVTREDEPQLFRLAQELVEERAALRETLRAFFAEL